MKKFLVLSLALLVCSLSPLAADSVIHSGIDVFTTIDNGQTFYSFANNPIPAGFFCKGSAPFAGKVVLKGLPLQTEKPGALRGGDTVIERLADATFDAKGNALTPIQVRALSLVSSQPLQTSCGAFDVYVTLASEQRVTTMRLQRTEELGGTFVAPLAIDALMTFVPVNSKARGNLQLVGSFNLPSSVIPWSTVPGEGVHSVGAVAIDTNRDGVVDLSLPGSSNFAPGWLPGGGSTIVLPNGCRVCEPQSCHTDPATGKQHCTGPVTVCSPAACP